MKSLLTVAGALFLLICVGSCSRGRGVDAVLNRTDTLMLISPDSARSAARMLDSLDITGASDDQRARRALLLTKAHEKAYIPVTDDSLITLAADYYRGRGDSLEVQSLFYRGVVLGNTGDYPDALISLMEAKDRADDIGDHLYAGMVAYEMADMYTKFYEFYKAADSYQEAIEAFYRAGRADHAACARLYLPQVLTYSDRMSQASDSIKVLLNDSIILSDTTLLSELLTIACNVAFINKDYNKSEEYYNSILEGDRQPDSKFLLQMAKVKLNLGEPEEALARGRMALSQAKDRSDTTAYLTFMAEYYANINDFKNAHRFARSAQNDLVPQINWLITHPFTSKIIDYYHLSDKNNRLKKKLAEERTTIVILVATLVLLLLVAITTIWYLTYRRRMRQKSLEAQLLLADLDKLRAELAEIQLSNPDKKNDNNLLISDSYDNSHSTALPGDLLNVLCETKYLKGNIDNDYKKLGQCAADLIDSLRSEEMLANLEMVVNRSYNNIMTRFRELAPGLSDNFYKVMMLTISGFSNYSICQITQLAGKTVSNIRSQIRSKIILFDDPEREFLMNHFADRRHNAQ